MKPKTILWITIFAVSMGYFESAIVIYLRQVVYPGGFAFPLKPITQDLAITEIIREAFSLLMLLSVSILTGKSTIRSFAYFLFSFAVWDIFYYVFLKALINWPESLMTMDVLFLLPVTWIGPVITPIILSVIMIIFALLMLYFSSYHEHTQLKLREILILIFGALIVIVSFTADYTNFILDHYSLGQIWSLPTKSLFELSVEYYPENFYWSIYWFGVMIILTGIGLYTYRNILVIKQTKRGDQ